MDYFALGYILLVFVLPVLCVYYHLIPRKHYLHIFYSVSTIGILTMVVKGWGFSDFGIRTDNIAPAFAGYMIITLTGLLISFLYLYAHGRRRTMKISWRFIAFHAIPLSLLQETLYRSIQIPLLHLVFPSFWMVIIANALLFTFLHIVYAASPAEYGLTFIISAFLCLTYMLYPNLILVSVTHTLLNIVVVSHGYFSKVRA